METGTAMGTIYMEDLVMDPANKHKINQKFMIVRDANGANLVFVHTDLIASGMVVEFDRVNGQNGLDDYAVNVQPKVENGTASGLYHADRITDPVVGGRSGLDLGYFKLTDANGDDLPYIRNQKYPDGTALTFNRIKGDPLLGLEDSAINVRL